MPPVPAFARRAARAVACIIVLLPALAAAGASAQTIAPSPAPGVTNRVTASIAYTDASKSKVPVWKNIRVTIAKDDAVLLSSAPLPMIAADSFSSAPVLRAVDLDDDQEAEVIVDVFAGSGECCRRSVVYHRTGTTYAPQVLTWGSPYRLADVTGGESPEFLSTDARVPAAWDASARGPLRVLALRKGKVRDISRQVPRELRRDAAIHRSALRKLRRAKTGDARPVIVAYVADLVRLGKLRDARAVIRGAARRHELRTSTSRFERTLDGRLVAWGFSPRRLLTR